MAYRRFPGQRPIARPMQPVMRRPFGGFGACGPSAAGGTGNMTGPVPSNQGGNAVQGRGIVFNYVVSLASLAAGATSSAIPLQFDANSVFVWERSSFSATINHAAFTYNAVPVPNVGVVITDTGKGASFMNASVPVYQIASVIPGLPYMLPTPQLIQANASFTWTFNNFDAAVTYTDISFQLHGFRVFVNNPGAIQSIADLLAAMGS